MKNSYLSNLLVSYAKNVYPKKASQKTLSPTEKVVEFVALNPSEKNLKSAKELLGQVFLNKR